MSASSPVFESSVEKIRLAAMSTWIQTWQKVEGVHTSILHLACAEAYRRYNEKKEEYRQYPFFLQELVNFWATWLALYQASRCPGEAKVQSYTIANFSHELETFIKAQIVKEQPVPVEDPFAL